MISDEIVSRAAQQSWDAIIDGAEPWAGQDEETIRIHTETTRAVLEAAGFGLVADAVVIHVAHDTEAHARSFNEGYETAIAQGLADDPSLAQDWIDGKLADAGAKALEDAADELPNPSDGWGMNQRTWLRARAAAVRGEG